MGLDTVYVETPEGHPHLLWALDRHTHTQKLHTFNHALLQAYNSGNTHMYFNTDTKCTLHIILRCMTHTHDEYVQRALMQAHAQNIHKITHAFTDANKVRHGIKDFRKDKLPWRTAMDYWLV